jgi:ABC-type multidrug transport system permease subunit
VDRRGLPLTHFLRLIRGVMLRGASLWELWADVLALLAFTTVMMTVVRQVGGGRAGAARCR